MTDILISCVTGSQSFRGSTGKFHVFSCNGKEMHINQAARVVGSGITKASRVVVQNAKAGAIADVGMWASGNYNVPSGTVLKIYGHRIHPARTRRGHANAYLRCREDAALRRIVMNLWSGPGDSEWAHEQVWFQGRFDLLGDDASRRRFGVVVNPMYRSMGTQEAFDSVFEAQVLESEITPLDEVPREREVVVGEQTMRVPARRIRRRMDLRTP